MERKKVLVVDDNSLLSKTIDICLRKRGHDVRVFCNGTDAVKYLSEEKPDSIVMDMKLPDCDGWFIARLLGELEWAKNIPLIVTSVLEPEGGKAADVKLYAYIQKPFDMGLLLQTVERSLSESRASLSENMRNPLN
jgi:DNA-binding response OmpR family regulator